MKKTLYKDKDTMFRDLDIYTGEALNATNISRSQKLFNYSRTLQEEPDANLIQSEINEVNSLILTADQYTADELNAKMSSIYSSIQNKRNNAKQQTAKLKPIIKPLLKDYVEKKDKEFWGEISFNLDKIDTPDFAQYMKNFISKNVLFAPTQTKIQIAYRSVYRLIDYIRANTDMKTMINIFTGKNIKREDIRSKYIDPDKVGLLEKGLVGGWDRLKNMNELKEKLNNTFARIDEILSYKPFANKRMLGLFYVDGRAKQRIDTIENIMEDTFRNLESHPAEVINLNYLYRQAGLPQIEDGLHEDSKDSSILFYNIGAIIYKMRQAERAISKAEEISDYKAGEILKELDVIEAKVSSRGFLTIPEKNFIEETFFTKYINPDSEIRKTFDLNNYSNIIKYYSILQPSVFRLIEMYDNIKKGTKKGKDALTIISDLGVSPGTNIWFDTPAKDIARDLKEYIIAIHSKLLGVTNAKAKSQMGIDWLGEKRLLSNKKAQELTSVTLDEHSRLLDNYGAFVNDNIGIFRSVPKISSIQISIDKLNIKGEVARSDTALVEEIRKLATKIKVIGDVITSEDGKQEFATLADYLPAGSVSLYNMVTNYQSSSFITSFMRNSKTEENREYMVDIIRYINIIAESAKDTDIIDYDDFRDIAEEENDIDFKPEIAIKAKNILSFKEHLLTEHGYDFGPEIDYEMKIHLQNDYINQLFRRILRVTGIDPLYEITSQITPESSSDQLEKNIQTQIENIQNINNIYDRQGNKVGEADIFSQKEIELVTNYIEKTYVDSFIKVAEILNSKRNT